MLHGTGRVSRIAARISAWVDRADRALCAAPDERARRHGWTVTTTGFGSRRYRDPRFDALKAARQVLAEEDRHVHAGGDLHVHAGGDRHAHAGGDRHVHA
ncbi:hypothetical protein AB0I81_37150 [Nonomuraea sp. NPDC050404]|uniref:hypothetical protein n=1 Tax=Nonomuraea sp. NPDC050404 TaxID=3155783 RepID=UPI0033E9E65F